MIFDLPEPRDAFLGPEIARDVQRIASVRARMEEDGLTAEVVRVLRDKGYTVIPPGDAVAVDPLEVYFDFMRRVSSADPVLRARVDAAEAGAKP